MRAVLGNSLPSRRFETLDALRGVAALAVVLFHLHTTRLEPDLVPHGYLAVDFFFILSGFVVAHAYEAPLLASLSLRGFVVKRLIRLFPLAALGAAAGLVLLLLKWWLFPDKVDPLPDILVSGLFNLAMLPTVFGGATSRHELFPGNGALWTLFFELLANVLWAACGKRLGTGTLLAVAAIAWLALVPIAAHTHTLNIGFDVATAGGGLARVGYGFTMGVVLYRWRARLLVPTRLGPAALPIVLLAVLAFPWDVAPGDLPWWDLLGVLLLPGVVALGVGQGGAGRLGGALGALSYPVYVLHLPVLLAVSGLHQSLLRGWNVHVLVAAGLAVLLLLATWALHGYDAPLRRRLSLAARRAQT